MLRKLIEFIKSKMSSKNHSDFTKDMKNLLTLAQSDRERKVLCHIACQTSQLSTTDARKLCGWENMVKHSAALEKYLKDTNEIREAIETIATTQNMQS